MKTEVVSAGCAQTEQAHHSVDRVNTRKGGNSAKPVLWSSLLLDQL